MLSRIFILVFLFVPFFVFGQTVPALENPLELEIHPTNPRPGDTVTVRARNIPSDPGSVLFVWRINGLVVDQGNGVTGTTFTAGSSGETTTVRVIVTPNNGNSIEKSIRVRPSIVDIVWEGNTYTPPFYTGRPLPTGSSSVTFQAIPEVFQSGVRVSPQNLMYRWYINNAQTPIVSGVGKESMVTDTPLFASPFDVFVVVTTLDGTIESRGFITVRPTSPELVVYEKAPLLGVRFDRAITQKLTLTNEEVSLEAFPLYIENINSLNYTWKINGKPVENPQDNPRELTLRKQGPGTGRFSVEFSAKSLQKLFERASINFQLTL